MSGLRRAAKVDANQEEIVAQLRELGFDVDPVHRLKKLYDLVVSGYNRRFECVCSVRVEIKSKNGKLTPDERDYHGRQAHPEALIVARSIDDILEWFGAKE